MGEWAAAGTASSQENISDFVAKKREMFLVQMSLDVKKAEILKLDARAKDKEEAGADVTWCDPVVSCGAPQLCFSVVYPLFPKNIHRHVIGVMFTNFTNLDNERFCCPLQLSFPKLPVVLSFGNDCNVANPMP